MSKFICHPCLRRHGPFQQGALGTEKMSSEEVALRTSNLLRSRRIVFARMYFWEEKRGVRSVPKLREDVFKLIDRADPMTKGAFIAMCHIPIDAEGEVACIKRYMAQDYKRLCSLLTPEEIESNNLYYEKCLRVTARLCVLKSDWYDWAYFKLPLYWTPSEVAEINGYESEETGEDMEDYYEEDSSADTSWQESASKKACQSNPSQQIRYGEEALGGQASSSIHSCEANHSKADIFVDPALKDTSPTATSLSCGNIVETETGSVSGSSTNPVGSQTQASSPHQNSPRALSVVEVTDSEHDPSSRDFKLRTFMDLGRSLMLGSDLDGLMIVGRSLMELHSTFLDSLTHLQSLQGQEIQDGQPSS